MIPHSKECEGRVAFVWSSLPALLPGVLGLQGKNAEVLSSKSSRTPRRLSRKKSPAGGREYLAGALSARACCCRSPRGPQRIGLGGHASTSNVPLRVYLLRNTGREEGSR